MIDEVKETVPLVPTLLFCDLDGVKRAVRLSLVERIDEVPVAAVRIAAGQPRIELGGRLLPILASAPLPDVGRLRLLRLTDGAAAVAYSVESILDIAALGPPAGLPREAGRIAGVLMVDGGPVELLDAHWHFAEAARFAAPDARAPLCLLDGPAEGWMRDILAPLVAAAGYRVAFAGEVIEEPPAIAITQAPGPGSATSAPVIRLRGEPEASEGSGEESIYRYDREAILTLLREHRARAAV